LSEQELSNHYDLIHAQPLLIVISGPSGVGKDTVIQRMKERHLPFHFVVTTTTRPPRKDEVDGVDYNFVSHDQFAELIENGELLEYAIVYNDYKGIPTIQVRQAIESGLDVVMRIDVQGAATIRQICPEALLIFLTTESEEELIKRLQIRKSETPEGLKLRIATARRELTRAKEFDYVVINRDFLLDETVDIIQAIIQAEHHRTNHRKVIL
jgi:guanylate kinase